MHFSLHVCRCTLAMKRLFACWANFYIEELMSQIGLWLLQFYSWTGNTGGQLCGQILGQRCWKRCCRTAEMLKMSVGYFTAVISVSSGRNCERLKVLKLLGCKKKTKLGLSS